MTRFIVLTFGFMFWAYYEMSGGAEFGERLAAARAAAEADAMLAAKEDPAVEMPEIELASRAATGAAELSRISITPEPAVAEQTSAPVDEPVRIAATLPTVQRAVQAPVPQLLQAGLSDPVEAGEPEAVGPDLRLVNATRVNMRNGPGTRYSVLAKLSEDDEVEVLQDPGEGWIKVRVKETNRIGWMADYLVTAAAR